MPRIRIRDLHEGGHLAFDLSDLLAIAGARAIESSWRCNVEECISIDEPTLDLDLDAAYNCDEPVSGKRLLQLADQTRQVIDGTFEAVDSGAGTPWLKLEAIDSTYWEVTSADLETLEVFRGCFTQVEPVTNGAE